MHFWHFWGRPTFSENGTSQNPVATRITYRLLVPHYRRVLIKNPLTKYTYVFQRYHSLLDIRESFTFPCIRLRWGLWGSSFYIFLPGEKRCGYRASTLYVFLRQFACLKTISGVSIYLRSTQWKSLKKSLQRKKSHAHGIVMLARRKIYLRSTCSLEYKTPLVEKGLAE